MVTSIFSFAHNVFYPFKDRNHHMSYIYFVICNAFSVVKPKILLFGKELIHISVFCHFFVLSPLEISSTLSPQRYSVYVCVCVQTSVKICLDHRFQNNLALYFSLMNRCTIWRFHSGRSRSCELDDLSLDNLSFFQFDLSKIMSCCEGFNIYWMISPAQVAQWWVCQIHDVLLVRLKQTFF